MTGSVIYKSCLFEIAWLACVEDSLAAVLEQARILCKSRGRSLLSMKLLNHELKRSCYEGPVWKKSPVSPVSET